jgi:competence protein ComEA
MVKDGGRVGDALAAAGGVSAEVDSSVLAKQINLAEKVTDGQKIFIPFNMPIAAAKEIEATSPNDSSSDRSLINSSADSSSTDLISVNTASSKELESLPGIGTKKASDIIAGRPYTSIDGVQVIAKVGEAQWAELRKLISI